MAAAGAGCTLVGRAQGIQVLCSPSARRTWTHMPARSAFPAGRAEPGDAAASGRRLCGETEEEIGLRAGADPAPRHGFPTTRCRSGFRITPVVGWIEPPFALTLDPFEVAGAFEVPARSLSRRAQLPAARVNFAGGTATTSRSRSRGALHLGRDGGHALQPVPRRCRRDQGLGTGDSVTAGRLDGELQIVQLPESPVSTASSPRGWGGGKRWRRAAGPKIGADHDGRRRARRRTGRVLRALAGCVPPGVQRAVFDHLRHLGGRHQRAR